MPALLIPSHTPTAPTIDDITRRDLFRGAGALGTGWVLAGCGGDGTEGAESGPVPSERTVRHLVGTTTVPGRPRRVAVLSVMDLDCAVALDAPVVAAPGWFPEHPYLREIFADAGDLIDLGAVETSLERLAAAEPDLILAEIWNEEIYAELSEIAPTVLIPEADWREGLRLVAEAVGRQPQGDEVLAAYDQRVAELQEALGSSLETTTVSVIRSRPDAIRFYGTAGFIGGILADVGVGRPDSQDFDGIAEDFSVEQLPEADADVVFVWSYDPEEQAEQREMEANPLWQGLDAVRGGRVHQVGEHWYGAGPTSANLVLDDLFVHLVQGGTG